MMDNTLDDEHFDLVDRLTKAGWRHAGSTRVPGGVEVSLRPDPESSSKPTRSISGKDDNDAIRKELKRLEEAEFEAADADLSAAGWGVYGIAGSTDGVTLTFRRDSTSEHREIVDRQKFGKTRTEVVRFFPKELDDEQGVGG